MLLLDILLSALVAAALTEVLLRAFRVRGPWQRRWSALLVALLGAWVGGVWLVPGSLGRAAWIEYCLPFVLAGLAAAFVIAAVSPLHRLTTPDDRQAFEREVRAVEMGVIVFFWSVCALLLAVIAWGTWTP